MPTSCHWLFQLQTIHIRVWGAFDLYYQSAEAVLEEFTGITGTTQKQGGSLDIPIQMEA